MTSRLPFPPPSIKSLLSSINTLSTASTVTVTPASHCLSLAFSFGHSHVRHAALTNLPIQQSMAYKNDALVWRSLPWPVFAGSAVLLLGVVPPLNRTACAPRLFTFYYSQNSVCSVAVHSLWSGLALALHLLPIFLSMRSVVASKLTVYPRWRTGIHLSSSVEGVLYKCLQRAFTVAICSYNMTALTH